MSNSVRPQRRQPIRLPHPWDSPGKNTGVGCHFLLCLIPTSLSLSCPYSPGEAGIAWAVRWSWILEVLARGVCHRDRSLPRWRLYDLGESWRRSSGCCRTSPGPGSGIRAASHPGGALGGRRVIIQNGGGVRSSPSKSCRISFFFFIISQFLCH